MSKWLFDAYVTFENWNQTNIIIDNINTGYLIDRDGNVFKPTKNGFDIVKPTKGSHGYLNVTLHYNDNSSQQLLHRLVAEAFCDGKSDTRKYVNHIDGNKTNDHYDNLEWVTNQENMNHAVRTGLHPGRTDLPKNAIYSEEKIHEVCRLLEENKLPATVIAERLGVNYTLIRDIKFRNKHKDISSKYNINLQSAGHKAQRDEIIKLMINGYDNTDIVSMLNIDKKDIRHVEYCRSIFNKKYNIKINNRYKRVDNSGKRLVKTSSNLSESDDT